MIKRLLPVLIGFSSLFTLRAQTYEKTYNINPTDSALITCSYLDANGFLYTISQTSHAFSSSARTIPGNASFGELVFRKLNRNGIEQWNYTLPESNALAMHIEALDNGDLVIGGAFIDSLEVPNNTTLYASPYNTNAFILCIDSSSGSLQWIKSPPAHSYGGSYYASFDIFENEIFLPYIHYDQFTRTTKIKVLNEDGDSLKNFDLSDKLIVISEFKMDDNGNTYIAGTGSGYSKIGGADIGGDTAFGYTVYIAKLDPLFQQIWSHEYNYITIDFFPKLAFTEDRVAFITDTMPLQNGIGNHHLLKIYDHNGNTLYTDSIGPSFYSAMHKYVDLEPVNDGFVFATLNDIGGLAIHHIDENLEYDTLVNAKFSVGPMYVGFLSNDSTILYIHNYTAKTLVVNGSDSVENPKTNFGYNSYQQVVLSFSYSNKLLSVNDPIHSTAVAFPNPTSSIVTVSVGSSDIGNSIKVYSLMGEILQEVTIRNTETPIDLSSYKSGMYIITTSNRSYRVVKE